MIALACPARHLYLHTTGKAITDHRQYEVEHTGNAIYTQFPFSQLTYEDRVGKEVELRDQDSQ